MNRKERLNKLFNDYGDALYRYLSSFRFASDRTYDLVQATFMKAINQDLAKLDNPKAWLFRVGRNLAINELKRSRREQPMEHLPEREDLHAENPLDSLLQNERYQQLAQALEHLNDHERDLLRLQLDHEFSYRELAAIVGKTESATRVAVHRAKQSLREQMEHVIHKPIAPAAPIRRAYQGEES